MDRIQKQKKIALERIDILFKEAEKTAKKDINLANRYIELARKISMKTKARIPKQLKRKFCKHCYVYFRHGINTRIRTKNSKVIYYCLNCKKYSKFPFIKEKNEARKRDKATKRNKAPS